MFRKRQHLSRSRSPRNASSALSSLRNHRGIRKVPILLVTFSPGHRKTAHGFPAMTPSGCISPQAVLLVAYASLVVGRLNGMSVLFCCLVPSSGASVVRPHGCSEAGSRLLKKALREVVIRSPYPHSNVLCPSTTGSMHPLSGPRRTGSQRGRVPTP